MRDIFVFGSNLSGRHGKGAALFAKKYHGAVYGQGVGLQGNSYAIPTKDNKIKTLPLAEIKKYVDIFIQFAQDNPDLRFILTNFGCGLAGYKNYEIAWMLKDVPPNVILTKEFLFLKTFP